MLAAPGKRGSAGLNFAAGSGAGVGRFVAVCGLVSIPLHPNAGPRGSVAARTASKGLAASPHCALPARSACAASAKTTRALPFRLFPSLITTSSTVPKASNISLSPDAA